MYPMLYRDWLIGIKISYIRNRQWKELVLQPYYVWYYSLEFGFLLAFDRFFKDLKRTVVAYRRYRGGC